MAESMIDIRLNTKSRADLNEDAVAALRLALEGCRDDYKRFGKIAEVILGKAPETPGNNRGGVNMLITLHSAGKLKFEVVT